jgi:dihydrofolate synthase / folylpolyglutamate synthase
MDYPETVRYLASLGRELASPAQTRAAKFDLANIQAVAQQLGNPQRAFRSVHIAGTNGKGSTAAMMASILRCAGFRTGLYTSPHLERINERIQVCGAEVGDAEFARAFTRVQQSIEVLLSSGALAAHPTFFECLTAMAFELFAHAKVDFAVLEVGMGGRLDATNIVTPEVSVITQIAFDHENFLGHSIEQIAGEKAGIIKAQVPVVSAAQHPAALAVIRQRASELHAPWVEVGERYAVEACADSRGRYRARVTDRAGGAAIELEVPLPGDFQVRNAVAALAAARVLASRGSTAIRDTSIIDGIASVRWPGRLECLQQRPLVYLDGAHNPAAALELAAFWDAHFAGRRIHLLYGALRDKAVDEMAGLLFPRAATVTVTAAHQPRAISAEVLARMTGHLAKKLSVVPDAAAALEQVLSFAAPEDVVFVTGSLYVVGEIRAWRHAQLPVKSC